MLGKYKCWFCGCDFDGDPVVVELIKGKVEACVPCASCHDPSVKPEKLIVWSFVRADDTRVYCHTIDDLLMELEEEIEANSLFPLTLTLTVGVHEMTQAEIDAIPELDD